MTQFFRGISIACCLSALAALAVLLVSDAVHHLSLSAFHQQTGALALMLIGASYIGLQLSAKRRCTELLKGILLGTAFILWGGEQLLSPGRLVTAMDTAVVTIFVVDLGLIIAEHLKRKDLATP